MTSAPTCWATSGRPLCSQASRAGRWAMAGGRRRSARSGRGARTSRRRRAGRPRPGRLLLLPGRRPARLRNGRPRRGRRARRSRQRAHEAPRPVRLLSPGLPERAEPPAGKLSSECPVSTERTPSAAAACPCGGAAASIGRTAGTEPARNRAAVRAPSRGAGHRKPGALRPSPRRGRAGRGHGWRRGGTGGRRARRAALRRVPRAVQRRLHLGDVTAVGSEVVVPQVAWASL